MASTGKQTGSRVGTRRIVFLDRDGVINRKPGDSFVRSWQDFQFLPRVAEAIRMLNEADFRVVVITNQRGISLDLYSHDQLAAIHSRMCEELARAGAHVDGIYYCPHPPGVCECRKPGVALFQQAINDFPGTDVSSSIVVGDSARDLQAAARLGCRRVLIGDSGRSIAASLAAAGITLDYSAASLLDAVTRFILRL
jgi:histidinol-phosphate phosphatase family protein